MKLQTAYTFDRAAHRKLALVCAMSMTKQSQADEADINKLVARFGLGGAFPAPAKLPAYQDFEDIFDFQSALDVINEAKKTFMTVPAKLRARFDNDPQQFLEFVTNPENETELIKLGLAIAKTPEPSPTPPPTPPAP